MRCVRVAFPGVHGVAVGGEFQFLDGLAEAAVGDAMLRAEFDDDARVEAFNEEHGEGCVFRPAGFFVQSAREAGKELGVEWVEGDGHVDSLHG